MGATNGMKFNLVQI